MNKSLSLTLTAVAFLFRTQAAEVIYENASNYEGKFNDTRLEAGDDITLAGTARLLTDFRFEYFGSFAEDGNETARLRLYASDGPPGNNPFPSPGTLLYDSAGFHITAGYQTVEISDLNVLLPGNSLIWTVEFSGVSDAERVGLLNYNPPTIGNSANFFWQKDNGEWLAVASEDTSNNFAAQLTAEEAPVQPSELKINGISSPRTVASIRANSTPGKTYSLEYKSSVTEEAWHLAGPVVRATDSEVTLQDATSSTANFRVYRVREVNTTIGKAGAQANIVAFAVSGKQYALERTTDLNTWTRVETTTASDSTVAFTKPITNGLNEFFRVVQL